MFEAGPSRSTRDKGRRVEASVAAHLVSSGLRIAERNVEIGGAELDVVAWDDASTEPTVVFVEIRSRGRDERGSPLETVGRAKRRKLVRGATAWLVARGLWEKVAVRFDVIGVTDPDGPSPSIDWIRDAFDVDA